MYGDPRALSEWPAAALAERGKILGADGQASMATATAAAVLRPETEGMVLECYSSLVSSDLGTKGISSSISI